MGWTAPRVRDPQTADLWTWLIIAAYTQMRLARPLVEDRRRPWERPKPARQLSPTRVRRGFRHLRPGMPSPAAVKKPATAGPGRPPGRQNTNRAPRPDVGKQHRHGAAQDNGSPFESEPSRINLKLNAHSDRADDPDSARGLVACGEYGVADLGVHQPAPSVRVGDPAEDDKG